MMQTREEWDNFWKNPIYGYSFKERQYSYEIVKSLIPEGSSIFDYACGFAKISLQLEKEKECKIAGCDISQVAIKKVNHPNFYVGTKIKGKYDYLIISHFLEHIKNPDAFVEECKKHAKEIIILVPNNFRKKGEHKLMAWSSFDEFEQIIKGAKRVEAEYPADLESDFRCPIYTLSPPAGFKPETGIAFNKGWWDTFWSQPVEQWKLDVRQPNYDIVKGLIPTGSSVFDYACGLAIITLQLEREKGCRIAGCDFSRTIIDKIDKESFYVGDTIHGEYDYLIISHFLEHVSNPVEVIEHCKQHARRVIIVIPNIFSKSDTRKLMSWGNLEEFQQMFRGAERVEAEYPNDLPDKYKFPIYMIE